MKYTIPIQWMMTQNVEIEASSIEEAKNLITTVGDALSNGEYLEDSLYINEELLKDNNLIIELPDNSHRWLE